TSFLECSGPPRHLPPFPTRRSSDLVRAPIDSRRLQRECLAADLDQPLVDDDSGAGRVGALVTLGVDRDLCELQLEPVDVLQRPRSEEHTSELQSLTNLVCRLLLEKK